MFWSETDCGCCGKPNPDEIKLWGIFTLGGVCSICPKCRKTIVGNPFPIIIGHFKYRDEAIQDAINGPNREQVFRLGRD